MAADEVVGRLLGWESGEYHGLVGGSPAPDRLRVDVGDRAAAAGIGEVGRTSGLCGQHVSYVRYAAIVDGDAVPARTLMNDVSVDVAATALNRWERHRLYARCGRLLARWRPQPPLGTAVDPFAAAGAFIALAAASGVVGNVAYDWIKATVQRLADGSLTRGTPRYAGTVRYAWSKETMQRLAGRPFSPRTPLNHNIAEVLAIFAAYKRCAELGVDILTMPSFKVEDAVCSDSGEWTVRVRCRGCSAEVVIPAGPLDEKALRVTVRRWT